MHGLDRVMFVPAAHTPLKGRPPAATPQQRLAMLQAAIGDDPRFGILDFELKRGGVSYSIETARYCQSQYPNDQLFWIIGGDQLGRLSSWKDVAQLAMIVKFICLERPGYTRTVAPDIPGLGVARYEGHVFAISSTELRHRARHGLALDFFIPHKAVAYIHDEQLYRDAK